MLFYRMNLSSMGISQDLTIKNFLYLLVCMNFYMDKASKKKLKLKKLSLNHLVTKENCTV
jgi:hypothetical protein